MASQKYNCAYVQWLILRRVDSEGSHWFVVSQTGERRPAADLDSAISLLNALERGLQK